MTALYLTNDLMFSARVAGAALASQLNLELCMSTERLLDRAQVDDVGLVIVDLAFPGLEVSDVVTRLRQIAPAAHLVAYGPHVQADALETAAVSGCHEVLSRGQFDAQYVGLLHRHLAK